MTKFYQLLRLYGLTGYNYSVKVFSKHLTNIFDTKLVRTLIFLQLFWNSTQNRIEFYVF